MKKSSIVLKTIMALAFIVAFSSCSRDVLITKKEIRNLNLVKIGAPEPELPSQTPTQKVVVQQHKAAETNDERIARAENTETTQDYLVGIDLTPQEEPENINPTSLKSVQNVVIPASLSKKVAKTTDRMTRVMDKHMDIHPFTKNTVEKKELKDSSLNLLRLLLIILVAALIITVLGIILPKYIITIIVLVLLIAVLLFLLGE